MKFVLKVTTVVLAVFALNQLATAQDFPTGPGTGGPTTPIDNGGQVPLTNGGTGNNGNLLNNPATAGELDLGPDVPEIEDRRREIGFIGRNVGALETQTFVGPTRDGITEVSGEGQNAGGAGGGALGGGGVAQGLSFVVSRSNVRARVRPNFSYPTVSTTTIQNSFQGRIQRLPNLRNNAVQGVNVSIQGTTATLTGIANNQEAIDNVVGQLRMEPGVYRIVNEVSIAGQTEIGNAPAFNNKTNNAATGLQTLTTTSTGTIEPIRK